MNPREFINIFTVYPKTEPRRLVFFRGCVAVTLMSIMIAYLFLQGYAVAQLKTTTSESVETALVIPFPDITFTSQMTFKIDCDYQTTLNDFIYASPNCNTFLTQMEPIISADTHGSKYYRINFTTGSNPLIQFSSHNLTTIEFNISITDPTFVSNATNETQIDFNLFIIDAEFNPDKISAQQASESDPDLLQRIIQSNYYELHPHLVYGCDLTRVQADSKINHWWDFTGVPLDYVIQTQMVSTINSRPFDLSDQGGSLFSRLELNMINFQFTHDVEEMQITLLDLLGTFGGIVGITSAIYILMFGRGTQLDAGGIAQKWSVIQKRLKKKRLKRFGGIMLSAETYSELPTEERVKKLYSRMVALEKYLEEYVIDIDFLEELQNLEKGDDDKLE